MIMRLFIAIQLNDEIKNTLTDLQKHLARQGVKGNYTNAKNLHITLAFIGEYNDPNSVMEVLSSVPFTPFSISLEGFGCFRDLWWVGIRKNSGLYDYVRRLRRALADAQIPFDRKDFSPHITLIRKANGTMPGITIPADEMEVRHISLMRSEKGKNGMVYTEVGRK